MRNKILKQLELHKLNSKSGYRIYFSGELLIMKSGKYVWGKEGHAKNALIGSLKDSLYDFVRTRGNNAELQLILENLLNTGIVKIEYYGLD